MKNDFKILHERAVQITKTYLRAESDLIAILQEIDDCKGYRELGFKSLFEYATRGLGLSESVSFNFITIARKSKEVPKLQEMIQKHEMTVSNARMIAPVLTFENQEKWLSAAADLSKRSLEKEIAKEFPEQKVQERARYVSERFVELKIIISEELYEMFRHAQDLVSSQKGAAASLEDTLHAALELYLEKRDPQKKAERAMSRAAVTDAERAMSRAAVTDAERAMSRVAATHSDASASVSRQLEVFASDKILIMPVPGQVKAQNSRFIPARTEHAVRLRDQGSCTRKGSDGQRCSEKRWLEIHHIKPLSEGGETTFDNLTLICRGHHQLLHRQSSAY